MKRFDGTKLAELLAEQGRSVRWLAKRTGYHESTISRMLNGAQPLTESFVTAASPFLGVPVDWLRSTDCEPVETGAD